MLKSSYSLPSKRSAFHTLPHDQKRSFFFIVTLLLIVISNPSTSHSATINGLFSAEDQPTGISKKLHIQSMMPASALGSAAITSIHKDTGGRLWVAGQSGLYMHDGEELVSFNTMTPNRYFAPSLDISSLTEDSYGNIWASSLSAGVTKYDHRKKVFERVPRLPSSGITKVIFVSHDTLLYVHLGSVKGLQVSSMSDIQHIQEASKIVDNVSNIKIVDESIALLYSDSAVFRLNVIDGSVEIQPPLPDHFETERFESNTGKRTRRKIPDLSVGKGNIARSANSGKIDAEELSARAPISSLHRGLVFLGTDHGLYVFHRDGRFIKRYHTHNSALTNNHITYLLSDGDVLWIGTYEGLSFLRLSSFESYGFLSDSISNEVLTFSQHSSGGVWIGTYEGVYNFDPDKLSHRPLSEVFPHADLLDKRVMALNVEDHEIFIGTRESGLTILDQSSGSIIRHDISNNHQLEVTQILRYSDTTVLVSTFNSGLYSLTSSASKDGNRYIATKISDVPITILKTHANTIIAANENGVYVLDHAEQALREIDVAFPLKDIQPTLTTVHSLSEDSILIGTQSHGVFLLDLENLSEATFYASLMLREVRSYAAAVYAIENDIENRLWVATSNGLFLYSDNYNFIRRYTEADGLQANKFNFGSSFTDSDGYLYFGGSRGYNRFLPSQVAISTEAPSVLTKNIIVSGVEWVTGLPFTAFDSIVLNHTDRFITFEFSALDYADPGSTRYRHKLVGFDTDWIDIGNRGSATYTNLPAGEYVFRVQAVNSAGIWNRDGLSIDLRVDPAPWLTWWAFTAYFILFVGVASLFLTVFRKHMLRKQQLQQANEMQRVADRFADELQDQIDFQSKLTDSIHYYNKQLLYWARFCTDTTVKYEQEATERVHDRILFRLRVLEIVQDSLYYQGERLYANLHDCAARLADALCSSHPQVCNRLTTVNDVQQELVPAAQAIPIAIILAELFDNSLTHGFDRGRTACFVRFSMTYTADPHSSSDRVLFSYQDNGVGIPPGLAFESPESAGFAIVRRAGEVLGCELEIGKDDRSRVTASFQLPWS